MHCVLMLGCVRCTAAARQGCSGWGVRIASQAALALLLTSHASARPDCHPAVPAACSAYLHTNEEMLPHGAAMPAREHSTLFDEPVAVAGSGVAAATQAVPPSAGGATLPRCPATLLLCEGRPHWSCRACGRRYRRPQGAGNTEEAGDPCGKPLSPLPTCIFCGLPLGSVVPAVLFSPPCCS